VDDGNRPQDGHRERVRGCAFALAGCAVLVALAVLGALHTAGGLRVPAVALAAAGAAGAGLLTGVLAARARDDGVLGGDRAAALFDASPLATALADERGRLVVVNPALCRLAGRPSGELLGRTSFAGPADAAAPSDARSRVARPDGEVREVRVTSATVTGPGGRAWTLLYAEDVTDRVRAEAELRATRDTVLTLTGALRELRAGGDVRGTALEAARTIGAAAAAYLVELETGPDGEPVGDAALVVTAAVGAPAGLVGRRIPLDGTAACVQVLRTGQPLFLADPAEDALTSPTLLALSGARSLLFQPVVLAGAVVGVLAVAWAERLDPVCDRRAATIALLADETAVALDTQAMLARLEHRAGTDALTGLPNRRTWEQALPALLEDARHSGAPLTVALAELDHHASFAEAHGPHAGDALLRAFAGHCGGVLRAPDLLARWHGAEFAVALPACGADTATRVLERLRADLPEGQTASVGFAVWDGAESAEELLARADAALYTATSLGRDTLCGAGTPPPPLS
jgi:diguanylate cyclase (GGDEF)-like protein